MLGLKHTVNNKRISLINVYLPYDDGSNLDEFYYYLTEIDSALCNNPISCTVGDFNADVFNYSHRFGAALKQYCCEENLILTDME